MCGLGCRSLVIEELNPAALNLNQPCIDYTERKSNECKLTQGTMHSFHFR